MTLKRKQILLLLLLFSLDQVIHIEVVKYDNLKQKEIGLQ